MSIFSGSDKKSRPNKAELLKYIFDVLLSWKYETDTFTIEDTFGKYTVRVTFSVEKEKR